MRSLTTILLMIIGAVSIGATNLTVNSKKLNGIWIPIKQEIGGNALPDSLFAKQQLTIAGKAYTLIAESTDKGELKYANGKMDIYGKEGVNAGKHITAIYKVENEQLTICYDLSGKGYPASFETKGNPNYFLSVFKLKSSK